MKLASKIVIAMMVVSASSANAQIMLDFEGSSQSGNPGTTAFAVGEFYNGGTDSGGASGVDYGISFNNANFDSTSQFTQPFNINSSIAYMAASPLTFTSANGFTSLAFDQFFFGPDTVLNVFSGANGTGTLLASRTFGQNCFPACTQLRQTVSFNGQALSAQFSPNANGTGLDNLAISAVPEPATWAMMVGGFGMIGGSLRSARRKRKVAVSCA